MDVNEAGEHARGQRTPCHEYRDLAMARLHLGL